MKQPEEKEKRKWWQRKQEKKKVSKERITYLWSKVQVAVQIKGYLRELEEERQAFKDSNFGRIK